MLYVLTTSSVTLSTNSTLSIYGATIETYNVSVRYGWVLYVLTTSSVTLSTEWLGAARTDQILRHPLQQRGLYVLTTSSVTLSTNSTLSIYGATIGRTM